MNTLILATNFLLKRNLFQTIRRVNYSILTRTTFNLKKLEETENNSIEFRRYYAKKIKKDDKKPKVVLNRDELNKIINYDNLIADMNKILNQLKEDYAKNLSLRVSTSSIEEITIKTPEGVFRVKEIGQVIAKQSNLYLVDMINSPQYMKKVEEAISKANLGVNPQIDKTTIFLNIPKITREHRENLSKSAKKIYENALKKLQDLIKKSSRKVSESKTASEDLIFQTNETIKYQFTMIETEAKKIRDAKQAELLAEDK